MQRVISKKRGNGKIELFFALLAVSTSVMGINITKYREFVLPNDTVRHTLVYTLILIGCLTAWMIVISKLFHIEADAQKKIFGGKDINLRNFFIAMLLINALFLAAYYPGTGSWDTLSQIKDFFDGTSRTRYAEGGNAVITAFLNDHHPVMTTLLFSVFVRFGRYINNERAGLFIYSLLQIILYSYAYTKTIKYYRSRGCSYYIAVFFIFNPFLSYYAIMMLKDSLFAVLFLLYFLCFVDLYRGATIKKRQTFQFIILSVLLPLTKKTGIYIVVASNIVLLIHLIKVKHNSIAPVIAGIIIPALISFIILPLVVFPAFKIFPGGKQEILATLLQQSARAGIEHEDVYSEEDIALLNKIFKYDSVEELYSYEITDPIKNTYKLKSVKKEELQAYYKLWFKTGLKHPITYLKATAGTCAGYFSPTTKLDVYRVNHFRDLTEVPILVSLRHVIDLVYDYCMELPGLNILFHIVVYTWWIPLFCTYRLIKKRGWRSLGLMVPIYMSILTLVVGPCSYSRYALPLVIIAPIILCESVGLD